jgi:hypothetical protein
VPRRAEFEEMEQIQVVRRSMEPQQKLDASTIGSLLTCVTSSRCRSRRQSPSSQSRVFASRHPSMCRLACLDLRDPSMIEQACRDPQQKLGALAIGVLHRTTFKSHAPLTAESKASIEFDRIYKSEECALFTILYDIKSISLDSLYAALYSCIAYIRYRIMAGA